MKGSRITNESPRQFLLIPRLIGLIVFTVGTLAILGWFLELRTIVGIQAQLATMKFNTALLFAVSGLALTAGIKERKWYQIGGIFILALASLTLLQYITHANFGIDEWLITDNFSREAAAAFPGRMSPATAINFTVFGLGLILLYYRSSHVPFFAFTNFLLSLLALAGYLYDVTDLYSVFLYSTMALHTALSFFLLSIGLLLSTTESKVVGLIVGDDSGGRMARHLLPMSFLVLILTGLIWQTGIRADQYNSAFGMALTIVSNIVVVGFVIIWAAYDVKRHEAKLRESEIRFRVMFEMAAQGVILVDKVGCIVQINPYVEILFLVNKDELIGQNVSQLLPENKQAKHQKLLENYLLHPVARPMGKIQDLVARKADGTIFPVEISLSPLYIDDETYVVVFIVDITERKALLDERIYVHQLEVELRKERELLALKDRFVRIVSHEFRTPLAIITSAINILQNYYERLNKAQINDKLSRIIEQVKLLELMIREILDINRAESSISKYMPVQINVPVFVHNLVDNVSIADSGNHHLSVTCDDGILNADSRMLTHILSNLISNALKYSPSDSDILISATRHDSGWLFAVKDSGIGIPAADLNNLFEPFYRATNALNYMGTGLGLSIVKQYVKQHQGQVDVESIEGEGTTFRVTIPNAQLTSSENVVALEKQLINQEDKEDKSSANSQNLK